MKAGDDETDKKNTQEIVRVDGDGDVVLVAHLTGFGELPSELIVEIEEYLADATADIGNALAVARLADLGVVAT